MKTMMAAAMIGTVLCGITAGARAQDAAPVTKPVTIRLGVFLPSGSGLKSALGNTWFSAGADYAFSKQGEGQNFMPIAYVDYAESSKNGINADYIGVGPGFRYYTTAPGLSSVTPYLGAGIGAYFLHGSGNGGSTNQTDFGYKINLGVEFNQSYLIEANYTNGGSVQGTRVDGFNIQAGLRF